MDQAIIQELKSKLLQQKAELEAQLGSVADKDTAGRVAGDYTPKFPNYGDDNPGDAGSDSPDEVQAFELNLAVTKDIEQHLTKVNAALERIAQGTYGKDIKTGEPIPVERLRANPAADINVPAHEK